MTNQSRHNSLKLWERYAHVYDRLATDLPLYDALLNRITDIVTNAVQEDGNILDAGCGTGNLSVRLTPYTHVTAVDYSPAMLAHARKKTEGAGGDHKFQVSEVNLDTRLPFEDHSFDGIVCMHVLYALPKPEETLTEFYRVLSSGGVLVTANMTRKISMAETVGHLFKLYGWLKGLYLTSRLFKIGWYNIQLSRLQEKGVMHYWSQGEFNELLESKGFVPRTQEFAYVCESDLITLALKVQ